MRRPPSNHMHKDIRPIARRARQQGWHISGTRSGHLMWVSPEGRKLFTSSTPSDSRTIKNFRAELRRAGYREE